MWPATCFVPSHILFHYLTSPLWACVCTGQVGCPDFAFASSVPLVLIYLAHVPSRLSIELEWLGWWAECCILVRVPKCPLEGKSVYTSTWPPRCNGPELLKKKKIACHFFAACMLEFPAFLSETLEVLCLNDNQLDTVPPSVCLLKSLSELYLGK
jgi:hypothetical protein